LLLIENIIYAHEHNYPWNELTCDYAAENGHLDCLVYAHENGCPWNNITCDYAAEHEYNMMVNEALDEQGI